jgi:hypothetical protein
MKTVIIRMPAVWAIGQVKDNYVMPTGANREIELYNMCTIFATPREMQGSNPGEVTISTMYHLASMPAKSPTTLYTGNNFAIQVLDEDDDSHVILQVYRNLIGKGRVVKPDLRIIQ